MSHFPETVYASVFAARQAVREPSAPQEHVASPTPQRGFLARFAKIFGRDGGEVPALSKDLEELMEYHNPTLGVRELARA